MPRPNLSSRRGHTSSGNRTRNPLRALRNSREQRRREAEERAAREITNSIADNQNKILFALESIDFVRSNLPKVILETKSNPNQEYCDLERMVIRVHKKLKDDPQVIKVDIRVFDAKLLTLVDLLKQAVEQGRANAAYAASNGIKTAVFKIRSHISQVPPEFANEFVKTNVKYLDQWINLVAHAQIVDQQEENVDNLQKMYQQEKEEIEAAKYAFRKQLSEDPRYVEPYTEMVSDTLGKDRTKWTDLHREIHDLMVELMLKDVALKFTEMSLGTEKKTLQVYEDRVNRLYLILVSVPIPMDPNLLNEYNARIDEVSKVMVKADQEFDEYLQSVEELERKLEQLRDTPGALRARNMAVAKARQLYEELMNELWPQAEKAPLVDPDLLNEYKERIDEAVQAAHMADQELDEYLQSVERLEAELESMTHQELAEKLFSPEERAAILEAGSDSEA